MRESPAVPIIRDLIEKGATIRAHDPEAMHMAKTPDYFGDDPSIEYFDDKYEAIEGADAMLVVTEWKDFRTPDFDRIKATLREPVIFDGRLLYEPKRMKVLGIEYHSIGR
jgi:UDPglucose 6-dehydrogenase